MEMKRCYKCKLHLTLAYDHCHKTGDIRGLLCSPCNRALGALGDSEEGLQRALTYLRGGAFA